MADGRCKQFEFANDFFAIRRGHASRPFIFNAQFQVNFTAFPFVTDGLLCVITIDER